MIFSNLQTPPNSEKTAHFWETFGGTKNEKWLTVTCKPLFCGERGI